MDRELVVKVTTQHPDWPFLRQSPDAAGRWGPLRFVIGEPVERCDYWVVCDALPRPETVVCPPNRTFLVTWEPPTGVRPPYRRDFVSQFAHVRTCHSSMRHPRVDRGMQGHPWFVGRSYDELRYASLPEKTVPLVIITSTKSMSAGHRARLDFARALKERLGDAAQLVGRGLVDFDDKWDVLAPAKYALALENAVFDDWITEKLPDCWLAGSFPLYYGARNAEQYFPASSFARLDLNDVDGAVRLIERLLSDETHYTRSAEALLTARDLYLDRYQFFPLLAELLTRSGPADQPATLTLVPEQRPSTAARLKHRVVSR